MRTRLLLIFALQLAVVFFFSRGARAQAIINSGLSGTVTSASATLTVVGSVPVFTTPGAGFFILTEVCGVGGFGGPILRGNTFGIISVGISTSGCFTYTPGIAIPQGEVLSCTIDFPPPPGTACMVTGVLSAE